MNYATKFILMLTFFVLSTTAICMGAVHLAVGPNPTGADMAGPAAIGAAASLMINATLAFFLFGGHKTK